MAISPSLIPAFIQAAAAAIDENAEAVTALDQAIGDGDHVVNLQRGLAGLSAVAGDLAVMDWSAALQKIGMSLMSSVGGASGSLYGTLFLAMSKTLRGRELDAGTLAEAFAAGVEAVKQRGKADRGDKTMLDVLIPVAEALQAGAAQAQPLAQLAEAVLAAAEAGAESTRDMLPGKGRASFLGERARGYVDAGARTSQLMIAAILKILLEKT
jgi:dihydroxyacetone kinase-like protein